MKKARLMDIITDPVIMVRDLNPFVVNTYAEALRAGDKFPPLVLDRGNRLVCGHHRFAAYRHVFEPDHEVPVVFTESIKDVDLIIEAAQDNSRHGFPLQPFEKKKVHLRLAEFGIDPARISRILGITVDRVEKWAGRVVWVTEGKTVRREPLKRGFEHMAGRTVKGEEYYRHAHNDMGITILFHAQRIRDVLRRPEWVKKDEKTLNALMQLQDALTVYLKNETRRAKERPAKDKKRKGA